MEDKDLFKVENLLFVSVDNETIGSLYFGCIYNNTLWRGRIRLSHGLGPTIEKNELIYWLATINSEQCLATNGISFTHKSRGVFFVPNGVISQRCIDNLVLTLTKSYAKLLIYQKEYSKKSEAEQESYLNNIIVQMQLLY